MNVWTYGRMGVWTYGHMYGWMCIIPTYLHTYIPTYLLTYLPTYLPTYLRTSIHPCIHPCIHTYRYAPYMRSKFCTVHTKPQLHSKTYQRYELHFASLFVVFSVVALADSTPSRQQGGCVYISDPFRIGHIPNKSWVAVHVLQSRICTYRDCVDVYACIYIHMYHYVSTQHIQTACKYALCTVHTH